MIGHKKGLDTAKFHKIRKRRGLDGKVLTIAKALDISIDGNCWSQEFLENAVAKAQKDELRRVLRDGYPDEDGNLIRNLNIEETDPVTGDVRRGYKQLDFFNANNWEWAVRDARKRWESEWERFEEICHMAIEACGKDIQERFEFALPVREPVEV